MLRPISRIQTHSYIYTRTNYHECPSQTRGRQEETHYPSHRFRCLFLYLVILDGPHVPAPWEQLLLPPSRFRSEAHMKLKIFTHNPIWLTKLVNDVLNRSLNTTNWALSEMRLIHNLIQCITWNNFDIEADTLQYTYIGFRSYRWNNRGFIAWYK